MKWKNQLNKISELWTLPIVFVNILSAKWEVYVVNSGKQLQTSDNNSLEVIGIHIFLLTPLATM